MKKNFPFLFLIFLLFSSCNNLSIFNTSASNETGKVIISLNKADFEKNNSARTISPETSDGFSYKDVEEWNVRFTSENYSTNTYFTPDSNNDSLSVVLPVGSYTVSVEGTVSISPQGSGTRTYTYYGALSNVDITTGNSKQIEIEVGLKKTSDGIGHLDYTLTLGDAFSADCVVTPKLYGLSSWNSGELVAENWVILTPAFDKSTKTLTWTVQNAPSGYYRLEVTYQETGSDTVLNLVLSDNIVEISDGSRTIASDTTNAYKLIRDYWATKETSSSNGLTKDYPANINTLLTNLQSDTEWDEANIYFEEGHDVSGVTLPAAGFGGRSVNIYYGEMAFIKNSQFVNTYYVDASGSYTTISGTQTVKAFKTLNDVATFVDAVDYSEQSIVYIQINGHINETKPSTFSKVSNICINGAHGCSAVYNPNSSVAQDESKYNDSSKIITDFANDMDVLDFGNINDNYGIDITNIKGSVFVSDLAIVNANSFDGVSVNGQNGGLRFEYGNNTEEKRITVEGCYFKNNTGGSVGQSILLIGFNNVQASEVAAKAPDVDIKRCVFAECGLSGESGSYNGGVLRIESGVKSITVDNCNFLNNYSQDISVNIDDTTTENLALTVKNTTLKNKASSMSKMRDTLSSIARASNATTTDSPVKIEVTGETITGENIETIRTALISNPAVYVNLDFSKVGSGALTEFENSHTENSITGCGFTNATNLVEITLPVDFSTLGDYAFSGCTNLKTINNTSNITSIGNTCFGNCKSLVSIELPNLASSIPNAAFQNAIKLTTFEIPAGVSLIDGCAFDGTTALEKVVINGNGTIFEGQEATGSQIKFKQLVFRNSGIKKIICKGSAYINFNGGDSIFNDCKVSIIAPLRSQLPDSMTTVKAFYGAVKTPEAGYIALTNETFIDATSYVDAKTEFGDDLIFELAGVVGNYNSSSKTAYIIGAETTEYPKKAWSEFTNQNFVDLQAEWGSGDSDGSDNWTVICNVIGEEDINVENYPAFEYALNFGNAFAETVYATGWYVPTISEISSCIRDNKVAINTALEKIGYKQISGKILSSNQYKSAIANCMTFDIGEAQVVAGTDGTTNNQSKTTATQTCVIKKYIVQ